MTIKELLGTDYKEGMTLEEIETALAEKQEPEDRTSEVESLQAEVLKLKESISKSNSEAASYKKQLREKMSEDEQTKAREAEERADLEAKYNELLLKTTISENKAKLIEIGYEGKLAESTAKAMAEGNLEEVINSHKKHLESFEKKIKADLLKQTPRPVGEGESNTMTLEKFRALSPMERQEFYQNNPEQYREMYAQGGNE